MKKSDLKKYSVSKLDQLYSSLMNKKGVDQALLSAIEKEIESKIDSGEEPTIKKSATVNELVEADHRTVAVSESDIHSLYEKCNSEQQLEKSFTDVMQSECIHLTDLNQNVFVINKSV